MECSVSKSLYEVGSQPFAQKENWWSYFGQSFGRLLNWIWLLVRGWIQSTLYCGLGQISHACSSVQHAIHWEEVIILCQFFWSQHQKASQGAQLFCFVLQSRSISCYLMAYLLDNINLWSKKIVQRAFEYTIQVTAVNPKWLIAIRKRMKLKDSHDKSECIWTWKGA